jgi:hypothetical protein
MLFYLVTPMTYTRCFCNFGIIRETKMAYDKLYRFINTLAEKTDSGAIDWQETEHPFAFQVSFGNKSVRIWEDPHSFPTDYGVSIFNDEGDLVEQARATELDMPNDNVYYVALRRIYEAARRHAAGTEKVIDEIMDLMAKDDTPF